jgi:lipoate-protein ligase A
MQLLDLTLPCLEENLALDEALLLEAETRGGGEVLRFWEWRQPAVILGVGSRMAADVNQDACRTNQVLIQRRTSGGGTVLLGPGCLLYSLVLDYRRSPYLKQIRSSFKFILTRICLALADLHPGLQLAGISDLALNGQKVSGNAQQRKRSHLLHHGTWLYSFDLDKIAQYLHHPGWEPDYRVGRPHHAFLANLPAEAKDLKLMLARCWQAGNNLENIPMDRIRQLVVDKYNQPEWVKRR